MQIDLFIFRMPQWTSICGDRSAFIETNKNMMNRILIFALQCGRPTQKFTCPVCHEDIGGINHQPVPRNATIDVTR